MARPGIDKNVKFKKLVKTLGIPKPFVLGLLETLWAVAYESGNPVIGSAEDVEIAAEWPGKPKEFFEAIRDGLWIDAVDGVDDRWSIHDLFENAPDYVRKRASRERLGKTKDLRSVSSADVRSPVDNVRQRRPSPPLPSPPLPLEEEKNPPNPPGGTARKRVSKSKPYSEAFESFWKLYPKRNGIRVGKRKAFIEFQKIPEGRLPALTVAVKNLCDSEQLPKDAERFLRVERTTKSAPWEDWVDQKGTYHGRTNVGNRPLTRVDAPDNKYDGLANVRHVGGKKDQSSSSAREGSGAD